MRARRLQLQCRKLAIELFESVRELLFPRGILGRRSLAIEFDTCEA
jgi:hypothetical protein